MSQSLSASARLVKLAPLSLREWPDALAVFNHWSGQTCLLHPDLAPMIQLMQKLSQLQPLDLDDPCQSTQLAVALDISEGELEDVLDILLHHHLIRPTTS